MCIAFLNPLLFFFIMIFLKYGKTVTKNHCFCEKVLHRKPIKKDDYHQLSRKEQAIIFVSVLAK